MGIAALGWWSADKWRGEEKPVPGAKSQGAVPEDVVVLTPEQQAEAGIRVEPIQVGEIQQTRRVPGRVIHNANKLLEIHAPVAGVVKEVSVNVGDAVAPGQRLITLTSSEVGLARDAVLRDEADLRLAEQSFEWSRQTGVNVQELVALLDKRPQMTEVEKLFADKPLGAHREQMVAAYSRLLLAEAGAAQMATAENSGAVSQRLAQQRRSDREVAAAAFASAVEQSRFAAKQQQDRDRAAVERAARMVAISRERLAALVGPYGELVHQGDSKTTEYSTLIVRAPWSAIVDSRQVIPSSNVTAAQPLVTLVDLDTVWINAELYEQDYAAIDLAKIKQLDVEIPAVAERPVTAQVRFVSAGLSPQTQSVSLVAELPNQSRRYRPGMFAWIELPAETVRDVLSLPAGAVVRQDDNAYVFVADGSNRFRRVDVELGAQAADRIEIRRGLTVGDRVVTAGAFTLKSELILASEPKEEGE